MQKLFVGIDVSKKNLDVAYWQQNENKDSKSIFLGKFANDADGFQTIAQAVEKIKDIEGCESIFLVMEPTGGYEQPMTYFAYNLGWQVSLPNPKQVKDWIRGTGTRAKTDKIDALMLAKYGAVQNPLDWKPLPEEVAQLDSMLSRLQVLKDMLASEKNQCESLGYRVVNHPIVSQNLGENMASLERQIKELEKAVQEHYKKHQHLREQRKRLKTVNGVGDRIADVMVVAMHRFDSLTDSSGTSKGITAYYGLDPKPYESGSSVRKRPGISRQGNTEIRHYLFMGALGGVGGRSGRKVDTPLRSFYKSLVDRGKPKKVALVAAARKILVWCWAVFRQGKPFDPTRCQHSH